MKLLVILAFIALSCECFYIQGTYDASSHCNVDKCRVSHSNDKKFSFYCPSTRKGSVFFGFKDSHSFITHMSIQDQYMVQPFQTDFINVRLFDNVDGDEMLKTDLDNQEMYFLKCKQGKMTHELCPDDQSVDSMVVFRFYRGQMQNECTFVLTRNQNDSNHSFYVDPSNGRGAADIDWY